MQVEIKENQSQLNYFDEYPGALTGELVPGFDNTVWKDNRTRLAQLLRSDDFEELVAYYDQASTLQLTRSHLLAGKIKGEDQLDDIGEFMGVAFPLLREYTDRVTARLDKNL